MNKKIKVCKLKDKYKEVVDAVPDFRSDKYDIYDCDVVDNCIKYFLDELSKEEDAADLLRLVEDYGLCNELRFSDSYSIAENGRAYGEIIDYYNDRGYVFGELAVRWGGERALHLAVAEYCEDILKDFIEFAFDILEAEGN